MMEYISLFTAVYKFDTLLPQDLLSEALADEEDAIRRIMQENLNRLQANMVYEISAETLQLSVELLSKTPREDAPI